MGSGAPRRSAIPAYRNVRRGAGPGVGQTDRLRDNFLTIGCRAVAGEGRQCLGSEAVHSLPAPIGENCYPTAPCSLRNIEPRADSHSRLSMLRYRIDLTGPSVELLPSG